MGVSAPHRGRLGTASYGLTRGLARNGVEVIFVVPKAYGDEDQRFVRIVNASDVEALYEKPANTPESYGKRVSFIQIDSNLVPYSSPEEFASLGEAYRKAGEKRTFPGEVWRERYNFSGRYGANLMEEAARYATVAAQVARDLAGKFDVIHAHDWLTYYAGMAAKAVSGKPLVVHMHATEFDRSGEHINRAVYDIERAGMEAADRVIAVSNLTRNIVITKYGIPPEKVVTVPQCRPFFGERRGRGGTRPGRQNRDLSGTHHLPEGAGLLRRSGGEGAPTGPERPFRHGRERRPRRTT